MADVAGYAVSQRGNDTPTQTFRPGVIDNGKYAGTYVQNESDYLKYTGTIPSAGKDIPTSNYLTPTQLPTTITGQNTTPTQSIPIAQSPQRPDLTSTVLGNNYGLTGNGLTAGQNGLFEYNDPFQQTIKNGEDNFQSLLKGLRAPVNTADIYSQEYQNAGIQQKQQDVQNYANQLNSITAKMQADQLRVTGEGRGIPEVIIGGQQAQIAKEAAIQALPIQAQLAAAQGNLALAQEHLDTVFKLKAQDAQAQNDFYNKQVQLAYDFFDKQEQKKLNVLTRQSDQNTRQIERSMDFAKDLASKAFTEKNYALGGQIANAALSSTINPNSKTFAQDLTAFNQKIGSYASRITAGGSESVPTVKTINGVDMQWNPKTGKWETPNIGGANGNTESTQKATEQLSFLKDTASKALELSNAAGPSAITRFFGDAFIGDSKFRQLEQQTNTLKVNVLSLVSDPTIKKFFGPQMSDADVRLMTSAGTTLNPQANSPTQMKEELGRLQNLFNRMEVAVKNQTGQVMVSPDGKQQVDVTSLSPAQIEEARKAGWK